MCDTSVVVTYQRMLLVRRLELEKKKFGGMQEPGFTRMQELTTKLVFGHLWNQQINKSKDRER